MNEISYPKAPSYMTQEKWQIKDMMQFVVDFYDLPKPDDSDKLRYRKKFEYYFKNNPKPYIVDYSLLSGGDGQNSQLVQDEIRSYWEQYKEKKGKQTVLKIPRNLAIFTCTETLFDYFKQESRSEDIQNAPTEKDVEEYQKMRIQKQRDYFESQMVDEEEGNKNTSCSEKDVNEMYYKYMLEAIFDKFYSPFNIDKLIHDMDVVSAGDFVDVYDRNYLICKKRLENPKSYFKEKDIIAEISDKVMQKLSENFMDEMLDKLADKIADRMKND